MRRLLNLRFFDEKSYSDMGDEDFQRAMDSIRYADFNEDETPPDSDPAPAPAPDDTPEPPAAPDDDTPPGEPAPAPAAPGEPAPAPVPEPPAPGIPPQLAEKYAPLIGALENDPQFRAAMADAIAARRSGYVPAAAPQAEQQRPPEEDKEPVCGEDELLEDFEKRHKAWEQRQQDLKVRDQVNRALFEQQVAFQREQLIRRADDVNTLLRQDAEAPAVGDFFKKNPAPARLARLMDEDPDVFMYVYDGMRQIIGKGNYFAEVFAKRRGGRPAAQPVPVTVTPQATLPGGGAAALPVPAAPPSGRTHVKGPQAPFTESGGNKGKGGNGPNFMDMSDKEFALYMERVKMQGL
ncbi:MAG: hypothetical protein Q4C86_10700 [bacterium]|nr:hypothetical protein [bacterium]